MAELLGNWKRTCYCTELTTADAGKEVTGAAVEGLNVFVK